VICDHDAPDAYDLLRDAVAGPAGYVAMMASRDRTANVLAMLRDEGAGAATMERVHLPAGLNLGGKTPGEIALSVVAEIQAWSNGRTGRPMREGESP
jgi:xanthine/CO dehydrogenase XdhC/CoxF family maturation factor